MSGPPGSGPFGNFDRVPFAVEQLKEASALPVLLYWPGADTADYQSVPDFFDLTGEEHWSRPGGCRIFKNENDGMSRLVELQSDTILGRLLCGGEPAQAELFRVPGRRSCNVSHRDIGWLRYSQQRSQRMRRLDFAFEEIAPLHPGKQ